MFQDALQSVILPAMDKVIDAIRQQAHQHASVPMLSRTHGQVIEARRSFTSRLHLLTALTLV